MVWPVCFVILTVTASLSFIGCSKHGKKSSQKTPKSPHVRSTKKEVLRAPVKKVAPRPVVKKEEVRPVVKKEETPTAPSKEKDPSPPIQEKEPSPSPSQRKVIFEMDTKKEEKFPRPDFDKELPNILPFTQKPRKAAEEEIEIDVEIEIGPPAGAEQGPSKKEIRRKESRKRPSRKNESCRNGNSIEMVKSLK